MNGASMEEKQGTWGCRSWRRGGDQQGAVPTKAALPSRVLDLEIPADVGYFHQEGVIRGGASQLPFGRKRIQMPCLLGLQVQR